MTSQTPCFRAQADLSSTVRKTNYAKGSRFLTESLTLIIAFIYWALLEEGYKKKREKVDHNLKTVARKTHFKEELCKNFIFLSTP